MKKCEIMNMRKKIWDFCEYVLYAILVKCFHMSFIEKRWEQFLQFIKFGLVGILNTLISYVVYLVGITFGMHYLAASITGFIVSVINSFYWNNRYVFTIREGEKRNLWKAFLKTVMAYAGTGLVLNNALLFLQVAIWGWSKTIAPLVNLLITIPLNFIINKLWAFRKES